jgi:hypothetical protein
MQTIGALPDGRTLYWANPDTFDQPGFKVWDEQAKDHIPIELVEGRAPGGLKTEIDLGRLYADGEIGETIADKIIEAAADLLVREGGVKVTQGLDTEIKNAREAMIDRKLEEAITEALSKPLRQTDLFGTAKGDETITLNELVLDRFKAFLKRADAVDHSRPRYGGEKTVLEKMIDDAIGRTFKGEIEKAVKKATEQAEETVKAAAAEVLAESIKRAGTRL